MKNTKIRPNKNKCVSGNRSENFKVTGKVGTHNYLIYFFGKNKILCILKGILPFKINKIIYFSINFMHFERHLVKL